MHYKDSYQLLLTLTALLLVGLIIFFSISTLVNVYVDLVVFMRIAGTS